ncbi:MAG: DUF960 family protein [Candidatus Scatosoma sp.]
MFQPETRYMTSGINQRLPKEIIEMLWFCIDLRLLSKDKMDYLQVFTFKKINEETLAIRNEQEKPARLYVHYTGYKPEYAEFTDEKIFVIDDETHSTMLFAYEY